MKKNNYIGLTYGDPAGIGPEILFKTLKQWKHLKIKLKPLVIGYKELPALFKSGRPDKYTGLHSYECLKVAVSLLKSKKIRALVTGPVSKSVISQAGIEFSGQTEEIAKLCSVNPQKVIMLFVSGDFRVALFTRHIPLKAVSSKIKKKNLEDFILLLNKELKKWFHIKSPKIALLGLNPHASENSLFGTEEKKVISPVIKKLFRKGIKVSGPLSPDAALAMAGQNYLRGKKQNYDVYISLYHDQALPMFKAVCGFRGVNMTLGLPFLRVSPHHGTAFDIAGKNEKASNEGLVSAVKLVEHLLTSSNK